MIKIEYDIKLNEETGMPYIDLPEGYVMKSEDKFFAFEITRYILNGMITSKNYSGTPVLQKILEDNFAFISDVAAEVGSLILGQMKTNAEICRAFDMFYNFKVDTFKDLSGRDKFQYDDKLFLLDEGLLVYVVDEKEVYEYKVDGVTNLSSWVRKYGAF
jgi:hypothetical protein